MLLGTGGVIGLSQVSKQQSVASQASEGPSNPSACTSSNVGAVEYRQMGTEGCKSNEKPQYTCRKITVTTTTNGVSTQEFKYLWQKLSCVLVTTCNQSTGRENDCPCASDGQCTSRNCSQITTTGPKICRPFDPTSAGTRPIPPNTDPMAPVGTTTAPAASVTPTQPTTGGTATTAKPGTVAVTVPKCAALVVKLVQDPKGNQVWSTIASPTSTDRGVNFYCAPTAGSASSTDWALYRIVNGAYVAFKYGTMAQNSSLLPANVVDLQRGDVFECLPHYVSNGAIKDGEKCSLTIR